VKAGVKIAIGCLAAAVAIPVGVTVLLFAVGWALGFGESTKQLETRLANPAGDAVLVVIQEGGGGAAGWTTTTYTIEHGGTESPLAFHSGWANGDPRWTSADDILVCDRLLSSAASSVEVSGRTFVLRNRCAETPSLPVTQPETPIERTQP